MKHILMIGAVASADIGKLLEAPSIYKIFHFFIHKSKGFHIT